ncbi:hypothetical protein VF14_01350 [Nostoc linckia z18]|uniref:Uncharacterized protein n=2 Tax=Nostoc linckia TaxID=92942 RepID=A0A9Q6ENK4_NOSLI|nr:hypothetical protein VF02_03965 [Nostoc linckia z1]PHJ72852.1 hypothetical protein VF05_02885 [Nostoc linckia z3]PHJ77492.1 hypothetical protein VF03_04510 [Nostoc linckia z2]PHJ86432.1 hypothetical protein VF06_02790 [Nostoc linckia z4]PHJ91204.1 hypothetical protein VF07_05790 [Nostoc linckia z6]PHJ99116.1 hypothetical protein VF04_07600 [Nostoc linckia z7]PHK07425.1 hypothetical protein VF08_00200 [Nostoc linckia z8]PHK11985.1 hypothetical protein VF09_04890 [Nostoc linckia z9]PHK1880
MIEDWAWGKILRVGKREKAQSPNFVREDKQGAFLCPLPLALFPFPFGIPISPISPFFQRIASQQLPET